MSSPVESSSFQFNRGSFERGKSAIIARWRSSAMTIANSPRRSVAASLNVPNGYREIIAEQGGHGIGRARTEVERRRLDQLLNAPTINASRSKAIGSVSRPRL